MGLLGGFKGKLIGKQKKTKEKKDERETVVCVKFKTFSEFDDVMPSCSTQNLGRNEVVRERTRPFKPEIKNVFGPTINGDAKKGTTGAQFPVNAAKSPANAASTPDRETKVAVNAAKYPVNAAKSPVNSAKSPTNAANTLDSETNATRFPTEEIYGVYRAPPPYAAKSPTKATEAARSPTKAPEAVRYPPTEKAEKAKSPTKATEAAKSPTKATEAAKSPTKVKEAVKPPTKATEAAKSPTKVKEAAKSPTKATEAAKSPTKAPEAAKSTKIAETSPKAANSNSFLKVSIPAAKSAAPKPPAPKQPPVDATPRTQTIQFPLEDSDSDDEGNFKIHFATKVNPNFAELSDDDDWGGDKDDLSPITYSSQATSIFFGGDDEPIMMRPRNIRVDDDNFSDGSSASA